MSELTLDQEKHIKYLIDTFDFEKVHKIMIDSNWKWANYSPITNELEYAVPTIFELKKDVTLLLEKFEYSYCHSASCGGFKVVKHDDYLELQFVVSECQSYPVNSNEPRYEILKNSKTRKKKLNTINKL